MIKFSYNKSTDSDFFYTTKFFLSDPAFLLQIEDRKIIFLDQREIGFFNEQNKQTNLEAFSLEKVLEKVSPAGDLPEVAEEILISWNLIGKEINVPVSFPLDLADYLRQRGFKLKVLVDFCPQRKFKNLEEIALIEKNYQGTKKAYTVIEDILQASEIKGQEIFWQDELLTSEILKKEVNQILMKENLVNTEGIIISSGQQTALPHHAGSGQIFPYSPIICDIFPQNQDNRFFADMTRTYFKGQPSESATKMYEAVLEVQKMMLAEVRPGLSCRELFEFCLAEFKKRGFLTNGESGFIHGLGHGLGLDIHEAPFLKRGEDNYLKVGQVVTIEPGLYYPKIGGVRIEDAVFLAETGAKNLTDYPKDLLIF